MYFSSAAVHPGQMDEEFVYATLDKLLHCNVHCPLLAFKVATFNLPGSSMCTMVLIMIVMMSTMIKIIVMVIMIWGSD